MRKLTREEVVAMWLWGDEYAPSGLSAIDWYRRLDGSRRHLVKQFLEELDAASPVDTSELNRIPAARAAEPKCGWCGEPLASPAVHPRCVGTHRDARAAESEEPTPDDAVRVRCLHCYEWNYVTLTALRAFVGSSIPLDRCGHLNNVERVRRFALDAAVAQRTEREVERLRAEVAAAREDTRRLDWMGRHYARFDHAVYRGPGTERTTVEWHMTDHDWHAADANLWREDVFKTEAPGDFRAAIDAAIKIEAQELAAVADTPEKP